jgi:hypothetical protein
MRLWCDGDSGGIIIGYSCMIDGAVQRMSKEKERFYKKSCMN